MDFTGIKIKRLDEKAIIPSYQTEGSSGLDLHSIERVIIQYKDIALVRTGLSIEMPHPYMEAQIRPRSGLAAKHRIFVLNSPGTIDSDYKGEIKVIIANFSDTLFKIEEGDRIAQIVFTPIIKVNFEVVDELIETKRGMGGFGSTGIRG